MFARTFLTTRARRRGVVLVVVLGMLGLLAVVGFTFATFANQSQINARNFSQSASFPDANEVLDFALSQLIDDTANPQSVLRGHSLKRDMYGNDAPNNGALLNGRPDGAGPIAISQVSYTSSGQWAGTLACTTNILSGDPAFYGYDFTRWVMRFPPSSNTQSDIYFLGRTHEILVDDQSGTNRVFYIAVPNAVSVPTQPPSVKLPANDGYLVNGQQNIVISGYTSTELPLPQAPRTSWSSTLAPLQTSVAVVLDGRSLRAFNGPGMAALGNDGGLAASSITPRPVAEFGNFRYNGNFLNGNVAKQNSYNPTLGNPDLVGMDEDYDACDLENWFLAIQSADGRLVVPSFHRPGVLSVSPSSLTDNDWRRTYDVTGKATADVQLKGLRAMSRILRPRSVDGHSPVSFPDLVPDATGRITYDVDNDGDGSTDSVWLDLGYPPKRNPEGQFFKPLFAFMVIGLNGKLPLNTAGNLQDRDSLGIPTFDHAEHLGNSPSEVSLKYALQNAFDPLNPAAYSQFDNAGVVNAGDAPVSVALTQLRNILAGTRPFDPTGTYASGDANQVTVNNSVVYLPNGVGDAADVQPPPGSNGTVNQATPPVAGRWGEEDFIPQYLPLPASGSTSVSANYPNTIRAGHSVVSPMSGAAAAFDARDDNFNTFDIYPMKPGSPVYPENADYYDASGSISLPVERIRRFVSPVDINGDGQLVTYNDSTYNARNRPRQLGADGWGRVSFFHYFRPPGVPIATFTQPLTVAPPTTQPAPIGHTPVLYNTTTKYDARTNNLYHGFLSAMMPGPVNVPTVTPGRAIWAAGTPTDVYMPATQTNPPSTITTFDTGSTPTSDTVPTYTVTVNSNSQYISPGLNEADEMDLYEPSRLDAAFGPGDLEWLYRLQDVDGASLQSRLAVLAPVSFLNPRDGARRRHLFALDAWDTTNFVWANDNPAGAFPNNSRFTRYASPSFYLLNNTPLDNAYNNANSVHLLNPNYTPNAATPDPAFDFSLQHQPASTTRYPVPTPALAHRDRRVNLNFPLPVSNDPIEPLRQKWVRDTYQLLKAILPPKAVDTPEELAQLSQYVVNIVDFRDPDCTMTKFVNTDVVVTQPASVTGTPMLAFANAVTPPLPVPVSAYDPNYWPTPGTGGTPPTSNYLIQYGMEYPPVAINEVLALDFYVKKTAGNSATTPVATNYVPLMCFELVNTLTRDAIPSLTPDSSDLDLSGWDVVVMPDSGYGRPDPYTGQIPNAQLTGIHVYPLSNVPAGPLMAGTTIAGPPTAPPPGLTTPVQALQTANTNPDQMTAAGTVSPYYYVFGNTVTAGGTPMTKPPTPTMSLDLTPELTTDNQYYWLYLRRPLNPYDPTFDPSDPNKNRVVVDSFRFVYTKTLGFGYTDSMTNNDMQSSTVAGDYLFSLQRMQPYRGGHAVPPLTGSPTNSVYALPAYGYSEQTAVASSGSGTFARYGTIQSSTEIKHTLGQSNSAYDGWTTTNPYGKYDTWEYLPFNDRDFTSVIELLTVPSTSPGLFTKQFGEAPPPIDGSKTMGSPYTPAGAPTNSVGPANWAASGPYQAGAANPLTGNRPYQFQGNGAPHPFPYLNDEFFYTASNETTWKTPTPALPQGQTVEPYLSQANSQYIGGPSGAGWHKMLDFFEVPSPAFKSIGSVALGTNYDWARQDTRPGLLNLNLIVDEEVFLGLMGESIYRTLNQAQLLYPGSSYANAQPPAVVTMVDDNGAPLVLNNNNSTNQGYYFMNNVGIWDQFTDPLSSAPSAYSNLMKVCFSDFLKLRHGGSGFLFAWGSGGTGEYGQTVNSVTHPVAAERPFHSLSYPDIAYTILRPAALPPSALTNPPVTNPAPAYPTPPFNAPLGSTPANYAQDPGVKNPYLFTRVDPVQPPPVPTRRLFQVPDYWGSKSGFTYSTQPNVVSNASSAKNSTTGTATGDPAVNNQVIDTIPNNYVPPTGYTAPNAPPPSVVPSPVANTFYDLTDVPNSGTTQNVYLGGSGKPGTPPTFDQRDHPYFRTEWLQKVANLTTVRTHQYAVWVTVGFFEVTSQGDPMLAASANPAVAGQAYDTLGLELGLLDGKNVRYRGFFLIDRTRAYGFNPALPGDFRDCVVYRQLIE